MIKPAIILMRHLINTLILALLLHSCELHKFDEPALLVPLTVEEDLSLPQIDVNQTTFHSETFGNPDSTMLVMLHGGPGGDYRSLLKNKAFADDGYFVVFYDQRGSGLSERHNAEVYNTQIFIDDLKAVIDHYQTSADQKVVLIGQSWGAMLAVGFANQFPNRVAGLVLTEPGGFTWEDTEAYVSRAQKLELFGEGTNDFVYQDQFLLADDHIALDYKMMLGSASDTKVGVTEFSPFWRSGAVCSSASFEYVKTNSFDFTTHIDAFPTKVFFGYSELNKSYGIDHAKLLASALSNVELVEFKNVGHEIPYFAWEEYHTRVLTYLDEVL